MKMAVLKSKVYGDRNLLYDDQDEDFVLVHVWTLKKHTKRNLYYCQTRILVNEKYTQRLFHRLLLGVSNPKIFVDHINHNGLDNRRENLRFCTSTQNQGNARKGGRGSSLYKGVHFSSEIKRANKPWRARIKVNGKYKYLGSYTSEKDAAIVYNKAALEYFGEFACLNEFE